MPKLLFWLFDLIVREEMANISFLHKPVYPPSLILIFEFAILASRARDLNREIQVGKNRQSNHRERAGFSVAGVQ